MILSYILFNHGWDRVVGNTLDQARQPITSGDDAAMEKYLAYLSSSLRSFARCHPGTTTGVRLLLVEIARDGLQAAQLQQRLAREVPEQPVAITTVGLEVIRPFLDEARGVEVSRYRSPNRLHEFVMFHALERARERHLVFADPDVTFTSTGALDALRALLLSHPQKWAASFVERPKRQPWSGGWMQSRERMHSVIALFDVAAMQKHLPFEVLGRPTTLRQRLLPLRNEEATRHYSTYPVVDTFSLLTEYLRSNWFVDRLLDFGPCLKHFHEGTMLTMVCELLVHSKRFDPGARPSLVEALEKAGLDAGAEPFAEVLSQCGAHR